MEKGSIKGHRFLFNRLVSPLVSTSRASMGVQGTLQSDAAKHQLDLSLLSEQWMGLGNCSACHGIHFVSKSSFWFTVVVVNDMKEFVHPTYLRLMLCISAREFFALWCSLLRRNILLSCWICSIRVVRKESEAHPIRLNVYSTT